MKTHGLLTISFLFTASMWSVDGQGQVDATREQRLRAYNHRISGKESPEAIPDYEKVTAFLAHATAPDLQLPPTDAKRLADFVAVEWDVRKGDYPADLSSLVCGTVTGRAISEIDATSVAIAIDRIARAGEKRAVDRVEAMLAQLSPQGRAAIERYISERVLPRLSVLKIDYVGRAAEFPEMHALQYKNMCEGHRPPSFEHVRPDRNAGGIVDANDGQR